MREANDSRFNLNILPHCKQLQVVAACQKALLGRGQRAYIMAPITPAQHHFSTSGNHCRLLTQQCYYYTFPGTAVQEGRPSHPLRHFLQKTACFHVQDGGLPSSAPSGGSDFASGNRGIILGAVAQGFNRMGLFFKAVVLAAGANVLFNHLVAGHGGQRPGRRQPGKQ